MVAIWTVETPEEEQNVDWPANRSYALQLFAASFIIFAVDSYLASITSGELSCNRAMAESAFSGGVLGIAAVVMIAGLAWLLVSMSKRPDNNLIAVLRCMLVDIGILITVMLAVSAQGIGQTLLAKGSPWFVDWAPYIIGALLACGVICVACRTPRVKSLFDDLEEPKSREDPIAKAVRWTCVLAVGDAIVSAVLTGVIGAVPATSWKQTSTSMVYVIVIASMVMPGVVLIFASRPALAVVLRRHNVNVQSAVQPRKPGLSFPHRIWKPRSRPTVSEASATNSVEPEEAAENAAP